MAYKIPGTIEGYIVVVRGLAESCPGVVDGDLTAEQLLRDAAARPAPVGGGARHRALHQVLSVLPVECLQEALRLRQDELALGLDGLPHPNDDDSTNTN